jgi:hypothetical protein
MRRSPVMNAHAFDISLLPLLRRLVVGAKEVAMAKG